MQKVVYAAFVAVLVSPALLVLVAWAGLFRRAVADIPRVLLFFLVLLSGSCGLLIAGSFFNGVFGPSYSVGRMTIIGANCMIAFLGMFCVGVHRPDPLKQPLFVSAALLLVAWSLIAAVNAAI